MSNSIDEISNILLASIREDVCFRIACDSIAKNKQDVYEVKLYNLYRFLCDESIMDTELPEYLFD